MGSSEAFIDDLFQRAVADHIAGRLRRADSKYRRLLTIQPDHADALNLLGIVAHQSGRNDVALDCIGRAVRLNPEHAAYHVSLGNVLFALDRATEAEAAFREALRLRPDFPESHNNLGNALRSLGQFAEAEPSYREALRVRPNFPEAHNNLGNLLRDLGRPAEAAASFREALRQRPDFPDVHRNLSHALLLAGRYEEGWEEYEWRWRTPRMMRFRRDFPVPLWRGEAIGNRTILLHAEQGFGDTLQFCRFVPLVAAGARTILEVQPPLKRLLSGLPGIRSIIAYGEELPGFDLHCPLLSLPLAFGTTLSSIPATIPYLTADPEDVAAWRERLFGIDGLRVGIVWTGGPRPDSQAAAVDRRRSMALETLAPFGQVAGVSFISLQKGEAAAQAAEPPPGFALHDFAGELHDFADTAALVENLDLVISVDTAVVHLAGALGKPVWLLNRFDTDWRWLLGRDDSPWYPTLRQFRQRSPGDWPSAILAVRDALSSLAAGDRRQLCPREAKERNSGLRGC